MVAVTHNKAFADALQPTYVARVEGGEMKTRMVTGGALSKKDFSPNALATGGVAGEWRLFHSMFFCLGEIISRFDGCVSQPRSQAITSHRNNPRFASTHRFCD